MSFIKEKIINLSNSESEYSGIRFLNNPKIESFQNLPINLNDLNLKPARTNKEIKKKDYLPKKVQFNIKKINSSSESSFAFEDFEEEDEESSSNDSETYKFSSLSYKNNEAYDCSEYST